MRPPRFLPPLLRRTPAPFSRSLVASRLPTTSTPLALLHGSRDGLSIPIRHASQISSRHTAGAPPPGYHHDPDSDYSNSAIYAVSYLSRIVRYILYSLLAVGGVSLATFEGLHLYVEHVCLAAPSREDSDEWCWASENQGWTGGPKAGTDPRLGQKARHALRGAWICQEWGAGGSGSIGKGTTSAFHPDFVAARGMIGASQTDGGGGGRQVVDRGYELADEYIDLAIREARKKGLVFPPTLSALRTNGPPDPANTPTSVPQGDPAVLDLLLLKAGVLERINTPDSLVHAKDLYEQVLSSVYHGQGEDEGAGAGGKARVMRLAGKVGDLSARSGAGAEALRWWRWGLERAGVRTEVEHGVSKVIEEVKDEARGWFGRSKATSPPAPSVIHEQDTPLILPPPLLRATISLLISASAHLATTSSLSTASSLQSLALAYIPSGHLVTPTPLNAPAILHQTWLRQRASLLQLHHASVLHALNSKGKQTPIELVNQSQLDSEKIISALQNLPREYTTPRSNPLAAPARLLRRDALLTGAESSYTRGIFLERFLPKTLGSGPASEKEHQVQQLEVAAECFERAMTLSGLESGMEKKETEDVGRGEEWGRYYRSFVRVRSKLGGLMGAEEDKAV
ncbi:hypothetical protein IAR55_005055 [Kwoniella newhampshirensis]|uniref:Uncharacterized protein n=1 Tax=Kwoniella newhampshirensis TaxID=1651941 RepID=A0AAW0YX51_9TREE